MKKYTKVTGFSKIATALLMTVGYAFGAEYIDFNKNGKMDIYENPKAAIEDRIKDLLSQMTLEEKTCQMASIYGFGIYIKDAMPTPEWKNRVWKDGIANIDEHLTGDRKGSEKFTDFRKHVETLNTVQKWFVEETRLGIPIEFSNEAMKGVKHTGATAIPAPITLGNSWDTEITQQLGAMIGRQGRALGYTSVNAPITDISRDPRWARAVECYAEDPYLTAQMCIAMVNGLRSENMGSTLKHFAVHSVPDGARDGGARVYPHISKREIWEIQLYPYEKVIKNTRVTGMMSSYNDVEGIPITANSEYLRDILRKQFGFTGYVISDTSAVIELHTKHKIAETPKDAIALAANGGLDIRIDINEPEKYILPLRELVKEGKVSMAVIDEAVSNVLRVKFELGLFDNPYANPDTVEKVMADPNAEKISFEAMRKSVVLLKNDKNTLPLDIAKCKNILVVGELAESKKLAVEMYGPNKTPVNKSILEGLREYVGDKAKITYSLGCNVLDEDFPESEYMRLPMREKDAKSIAEAVKLAKENDVVIAVLGETPAIYGETKSRASLDLSGRQNELLQALADTGKPVVVLLINGRPLSINMVQRKASAILDLFVPNGHGGEVAAKTIFGEFNPSGKLACTFPKSVGQIQFNFPFRKVSHNKSGRAYPSTSLYCFGYGLSYTKFAYSNLKIDAGKSTVNSTVKVSFDVKNIGERDGEEIVQLYVRDKYASVCTFDKVLRGFKRVPLKAGETKTVDFELTPEAFELFDKDFKRVVEAGAFEIMVGASSENTPLKKEIVLKGAQ